MIATFFTLAECDLFPRLISNANTQYSTCSRKVYSNAFQSFACLILLPYFESTEYVTTLIKACDISFGEQ